MRVLLLIFLIPLQGCTQNDRGSFTVTLKIDSAKPGDTITFSYPVINNGQPDFVKDIAVYKAGGITFKGTLSEPAEATLSRYVIEKVDTSWKMKILEDLKLPEDQLNGILELYLSPRQPDNYTFYLLPGETSITATQRLRTAKAEGPEALTAYVSLKKQFDKLNQELSFSLYTTYGFSFEQDEKKERIMMKAYDSISTICKDSVYLNFIKENPGSAASLYALKRYLPAHINNPDKYISLLNDLSPEIQQWESAKRIKERLETARKTVIGQVVEDFQQPDSLGKMVALSSFRGKYVLIELWASWCVPCRKKNPGLRVIQDKYADKNFTILGIALEEKGERVKWLNAIQKDKLSWPQLSDFKGWENAVARQLAVQSIPFNLLIDPNGKIIAKNLYDEELDTLLDGLLK